VVVEVVVALPLNPINKRKTHFEVVEVVVKVNQVNKTRLHR
jgi:hypothetical protein